jgi:hypothetical protein
LSQRFKLEAALQAELVTVLGVGWREGLRRATVAYDPVAAPVFLAPPFSFHLLPERSTRPKDRSERPPPPEGVKLPHSPCPFDGEDFVREREVALAGRAGRSYILACNRFPVRSPHFLAVRSAAEPEESLPQFLHGAHEVEDVILLALLLGEPYSSYFNSNRGADGSFSGGSVNHWHLQFFPRFDSPPSGIFSLPARTLRAAAGGVTLQATEGWPARHVFVEAEASEYAPVARALWNEIEVLNRRNSAYNLEVAALGGGRFRAYLFPRRPAAPRFVEGAGSLSPDIGGCELAGHFVIPTAEIFSWIQRHPAEAAEIARERLRETTAAAEV